MSENTARKWARRFRDEGELGLLDRSSAPSRVANRACEQRVQAIAALRRLRFTGAQIAELLSMPEKTGAGMLTRIGMGRLGRLGLESVRRDERRRRGELIHVDVKKLGRIEPGRRPRGTKAAEAGIGHTELSITKWWMMARQATRARPDPRAALSRRSTRARARAVAAQTTGMD